MGVVRSVRVHAPQVAQLDLVVESAASGARRTVAMQRDGGHWTAAVEADDGDRYWLVADGVGPLLDPAAADVELVDGVPLGRFRGAWPAGQRIAPLLRPQITSSPVSKLILLTRAPAAFRAEAS